MPDLGNRRGEAPKIDPSDAKSRDTLVSDASTQRLQQVTQKAEQLEREASQLLSQMTEIGSDPTLQNLIQLKNSFPGMGGTLDVHITEYLMLTVYEGGQAQWELYPVSESETQFPYRKADADQTGPKEIDAAAALKALSWPDGLERAGQLLKEKINCTIEEILDRIEEAVEKRK
jgi:hypothetical protein